MAQNKTQNPYVTKALQRAKQLGQIFLASLSKEELEKTGFDTSVFGQFKFTDIYLLYDGEEFYIKYLFNGDERNVYYEKKRDLGGEEELLNVVEIYMKYGNAMQWEPWNAEMVLVKAHPLGPLNGAIYVYEIRPQPSEDEIRIEPFYIASFSDDNSEVVWGHGFNVKEAIQDAMNKWAKIESEENPFEKLYQELYSLKGE